MRYVHFISELKSYSFKNISIELVQQKAYLRTQNNVHFVILNLITDLLFYYKLHIKGQRQIIYLSIQHTYEYFVI